MTDPRWEPHGRRRRRGGAAPQRQLQLRLGQGQLGPVHTWTTPAASGEGREARIVFTVKMNHPVDVTNFSGLLTIVDLVD